MPILGCPALLNAANARECPPQVSVASDWWGHSDISWWGLSDIKNARESQKNNGNPKRCILIPIPYHGINGCRLVSPTPCRTQPDRHISPSSPPRLADCFASNPSHAQPKNYKVL